MNEDAIVAAILTTGVLARMPGSGSSGVPERDRALRATEAVEAYLAVLKALRVAGPTHPASTAVSADEGGA
jgi:hypothetical protein